MDIQVININNLQLTKNLVDDLTRQTYPYRLRLIDQASTESGTGDYLASLSIEKHIEIIRNMVNVDIYKLWNIFYEQSNAEYLCFLNNDARIPSNFVKDTVDIFELESTVGCVVHATNHKDYQKTTPLNYVIVSDSICQGWDFTIRRSAYTEVPEGVKLFYGDDFVFANLYKSGWKVAIALSSPVIHLCEMSHKHNDKTREYFINDGQWMKAHGYRGLRHRSNYTRSQPSFLEIVEGAV